MWCGSRRCITWRWIKHHGQHRPSQLMWRCYQQAPKEWSRTPIHGGYIRTLRECRFLLGKSIARKISREECSDMFIFLLLLLSIAVPIRRQNKIFHGIDHRHECVGSPSSGSTGSTHLYIGSSTRYANNQNDRHYVDLLRHSEKIMQDFFM